MGLFERVELAFETWCLTALPKHKEHVCSNFRDPRISDSVTEPSGVFSVETSVLTNELRHVAPYLEPASPVCEPGELD